MDAAARPATQAADHAPVEACLPVPFLTVSVAVRRPLALGERPGRRKTRTGRVALVRTSRWRI
ncbi:hypothetical protein ACFWMG_04045 [Streptomyces sp. NPDC127074]|uniref:hypothetical protein n=1 Tax=Streptomyces sp. NPDC127074 TaxID=3347130 RepID=UPI00366658BE